MARPAHLLVQFSILMFLITNFLIRRFFRPCESTNLLISKRCSRSSSRFSFLILYFMCDGGRTILSRRIGVLMRFGRIVLFSNGFNDNCFLELRSMIIKVISLRYSKILLLPHGKSCQTHAGTWRRRKSRLHACAHTGRCWR